MSNTIKYLGYIINSNGISTDPEKVEKVLNYPIPTNIKKLRTFIGMANYYRNYIPNFANISIPLAEMTHKNVDFNWNDACQNAFDVLKKKLTSCPILSLPNFKYKFNLCTDASNKAIGAVLFQNINGCEKVISYGSRKLNDAEQNYSTIEKECLAIVWSIQNYRHYLYGQTFTVYTDHNPLTYLNSLKDSHGRLSRWKLTLQQYDFNIVYKPGTKNLNADALSRCYAITETDKKVINENKLPIELNDVNYENEVKNDDKLNCLKNYLIKNGNIKLTKRGKFTLENNMVYRHFESPEGLISQIYVPKNLINVILEYSHDKFGHMGSYKIYDIIRKRYYWPGYQIHIKKYVKSCHICQKFSIEKDKAELVHFMPSKPFQIVQWDIVGPLPITKNNNKYILVIIDLFSKWVEAFPITNLDSVILADRLVNDVICRYGIPRQLHSDNGTNFKSNLIKNVCEIFGIYQTNTTAYHPEGNGGVERVNGTIMKMLSKAVENKEEWDEELPKILFYYRNSINTTTKYTPSKLFLGRESETLIDKIIKISEQDKIKENFNMNTYVTKLERCVKKYIKNAKNNINKSHYIQDKHNKVKNSFKFRPGDYILLKKNGIIGKLNSKWEGPYVVVAKQNLVNYKIKIHDQKQITVHRNQIKKYYQRKNNYKSRKKNFFKNQQRKTKSRIINPPDYLKEFVT